MKAPSEHHLEDWIVFNPSRFRNSANEYGMTDIESAFMQTAFVNGNKEYDRSRNRPYFDYSFIRQVELSCGYADLVSIRDNQIGVVELKKNVVNEKTIVQLMKYINEIEEMLLFRELEVVPNLFNRNDRQHRPTVFGFAVGYGQPSKQTVSGRPSRIGLISYDYNGYEYSFTGSDTHIEYNWQPHGKPTNINNKLLPFIDSSILSVYSEDVS